VGARRRRAKALRRRAPRCVDVNVSCVLRATIYTHTRAYQSTGDDLSDMPAGRWVGIVYDEPVGKNDGTVKGTRLFKCKKNHGHLLRPDKVTKSV